MAQQKKERPVCQRCGGKGYLQAFPHVVRGVCFRCWGAGDDYPTMFAYYETKLAELRCDYRNAKPVARKNIAAKGFKMSARLKQLRNELASFHAQAKVS